MARAIPSRKCGARSRTTGNPCASYAIQGGTVCRMHGGSAPAAKRRAAERLVEAEAKAVIGKLKITGVEDPFAALQQLAGEMIALKDRFRDKVERLEQVRYRGETEQLRAEVTVYSTLLRDCSASLVALARLGLDERMVRIREAQADMIKKAVDGALRDAGMEGDALNAARSGVARRLRIAPALTA